MMWPWMTTGFGGWWLMGIIWLVATGLIVWLIVYLVRGGTAHPGPSNENTKAIEVLKIRYARGEIDKKEYDEKRKDLQ